MQTSKQFRQCLHPTPFGFALGVLVMAFSLGLWVWLIAQLGPSPDASKQLRRLGFQGIVRSQPGGYMLEGRIVTVQSGAA